MKPWMASAVLFLAVGAPAGARPWPDSSARTVVFSDQLPQGLTEVQRQFAAARLAGTQKMLRSEIRPIRAYNTNFLCLHYQLAVGNGPASFIDGDDWTSDWSFVTTQTNWFLLNPQTQRVYQTTWTWYLMNVTYSGATPSTAFPEYWITTCLARIRSAEDDGVFADSFTVDGYGFGQCTPSHPWIDDVSACTTGWIPHLEAFGRAVRERFDSEGSGYVFLPNLGGLITGWDPTDYGLGHGGMIESFCYWGSGSHFDAADWELQMDRALALARSNKIVICQSYPDTLDTTGRMFAVASYLLVKGARTYLNILTTDDVALEYYPEYTILTGGWTSPPPPTVAALWRAGWGVYRRDFTNGFALVNPGASPVSIPNLGTNAVLVRATGGGAVSEAGTYGGNLLYQSVTSLTLAAHAGAVLLFPDADGDGDGLGNRAEVWAGTDPMEAASVFEVSSVRVHGAGLVVSWPGVTGRTYAVERSADRFTDAWVSLTGGVRALPSVMSVTDSVPPSAAVYRVRKE